jgi:dihydroorotate dehydrogenase subfamily 2
MKKQILKTGRVVYEYVFRKIFFLIDSETIHLRLTDFGEMLGKIRPIAATIKYFVRFNDPLLEQTLFKIKFQNPVGLAAGFDYRAQLTQILPSIGFGFGTIGTITNSPSEGNPKPRLGRLIKSKSLMVNKGFRNPGIKNVLQKLRKLTFEFPVGISIGKTNTKKLKTQRQSIDDIIKAFKETEKSNVNFSYYELNISCPNLIGNISFYEPQKLEELLIEVKRLKLRKPVFIKMPIDQTDKETLNMLNVIINYPIQGVIFGNLQKNKEDPSFDKLEILKYPVGNFSGKPTEKRSNELIKLTYKNFEKKLLIIGCGGIFNAKDAYAKIKLGASLIQLITGLIYEGPLLPAEINYGLSELVKKDGFKNVSEAIGVNAK